MGTTTGCVSFIIIDKSGRLAFRLTADRNENPVNSGYKSRAAPGTRNRAPYPDQKIDMPGRRSGDKRCGLDHRGSTLKMPCLGPQRCDEITKRQPSSQSKKIAALYSSSNRTVRPGMISALG